MTMPSRGFSPIQRKATGDDMKEVRKGMHKNKSKAKTKMDLMNVGAAESAGRIPGMKCGGMAKGYFKGGKVDGCIKKGHTKGKMV